MSIRRLFCSRKWIEDGVFSVSGDEAYHAIRVLRLQTGDKINIFTDQGSEFLTEVVSTGKGKLNAKIVEKLENIVESPLELTLIQALPKAQKMEQIIVHGTELGLTKLIPVVTKRSIAKGERRDRWRRLALEATKQCGRRMIPAVEPVTKLSALDFEQFKDSLCLIAAEPPYTGSLEAIMAESDGPKSVVVVVGPEGGFAEEEVEQLIDKGFKPFSMGPRVLRTQTASLSVFSVLQSRLGDWS